MTDPIAGTHHSPESLRLWSHTSKTNTESATGFWSSALESGGIAR